MGSRNWVKSAIVTMILCFVSSSWVQPVRAQDNPTDKQQFAGIKSKVLSAIEKGDLPGAVIAIADRERILYFATFGDKVVEPKKVPMTGDTIFDLASITKPVATACSVMKLVQDGKLDVDKPVVDYLPEFSPNGKDEILVSQCLLHTSGLTPDNALADYLDGPKTAWKKICELGLRLPPGEKFAYSDVGFIVLGKIVERLSEKTLDEFARDEIFKPLNMSETTYKPNEELKPRVAPSDKRDGNWIRGEVHDPRSFELGGVAGHAGLFSTANDLVKFGQSFLGENAKRHPVFKPSTIELMTKPREVPRGTRTYGWDHRSPYSRNRGESLSDAAFGHGGFTGTVLWIDPTKERVFVFLSSRLHPDGKGSVNTLAGEIATMIGE